MEMFRRVNLNARRFLARSIPEKLRTKIPRFITKHLYFDGVIEFQILENKKIKMQSQGMLLENELYWHGLQGYHEKLSMKIWIEFILTFRPLGIVDIGANTGIYGLVAKCLAPKSKIVFVEPIPRAIQILQKNLDLNNFEGQILDIALSDYDGEGFYNLESGKDIAYSITLNDYADRAITGIHDETISYTQIQTNVARLDTLIRSKIISIPNLIKLDVETLEPNVLKGLGEYLSKEMSFLCEVLTWEVAEKLNEIFSEADYNFYNIDDLNNKLRQTEKIEKSDYWNYFICQKEFSGQLTILR